MYFAPSISYAICFSCSQQCHGVFPISHYPPRYTHIGFYCLNRIIDLNVEIGNYLEIFTVQNILISLVSNICNHFVCTDIMYECCNSAMSSQLLLLYFTYWLYISGLYHRGLCDRKSPQIFLFLLETYLFWTMSSPRYLQ